MKRYGVNDVGQLGHDLENSTGAWCKFADVQALAQDALKYFGHFPGCRGWCAGVPCTCNANAFYQRLKSISEAP